MLLTIVIFIITILVLVVVHELGHFLVAKRMGIKVLEFGFGIPPRIWGKKIGETLVSINALPFGGFVRLLGEDEDVPVLGLSGGKGETRKYFSARSVSERVAVVGAGVFMNLLLSFLLFYIVVASSGFKVQLPLIPPVSEHQFVGVEQTNEAVLIVGTVSPGSPAAAAGINVGDRIDALNDQPLNSSDQLISQSKQHAGVQISFTLSDPEKKNFRKVYLTPRINPPAGQGPLGISFSSLELANLEYKTLPQKFFSGVTHSFNLAA